MATGEAGHAGIHGERWERVADAFSRALEIPPGERAVVLDAMLGDDIAARREVDEMLETHVRDRPLLVERRLAQRDESDASLRPGTRVGAYEIVALIGEGGMGEVYRAERVGAFAQGVALKLLRAGLRSGELVRRFRAEREILGRLAHPNIVAILDGGETPDGRPYLAMQYVDGVPITTYCDGASLSIEGRLRLFVRVANAVQFAHGRLVVHRDLKPSNILVTADGEPRLLDFGIAKLLTGSDRISVTEETRSVIRLLTPEHASPEQLRGEPVTTASDVYALGVLLFQLLAGRRPHVADGVHTREVERRIIEEPAPAPSDVATDGAARRQLRGDIDRIVLTALRKEPERRYASAGQFAEDVERYLAGLPVRAHDDTLAYRARKFVSRNRAMVGASAVLALLLAAFATSSTLQARRVTRERDAARQARDESEAVIGMLTDLFQRSNPMVVPGGDTVRASVLIDAGERRVDSLVNQPALQARMWRVFGNMHVARAQFPRGIALLERSHALQLTTPGSDSAETARTYHDYARAVQNYRGPATARPLLERSLTRLRRILGDTSADVGRAILDVTGVTTDASRRLALREEAVRIFRRSNALDTITLASLHNEQGSELLKTGNASGGARELEQALALVAAKLGTEHPIWATVASNLAAAYSTYGDFARAESLHTEVVRTRERASAPDSSAFANALETRGTARAMRGNFAGAEEDFRRALALERAVLAPGHWRMDNTLRNVGLIIAADGRVTEGMAYMDSAIAGRAAEVGRGSAEVAYLTSQRANLLLRLGRYDEGYGDLRRVEPVLRKTYGEGTPRRGDTDLWRGIGELTQGRGDTALLYLRSALLQFSSNMSPTHPKLTEVRCAIGVAFAALRTAPDSARSHAAACDAHARVGLPNAALLRLTGEILHGGGAAR